MGREHSAYGPDPLRADEDLRIYWLPRPEGTEAISMLIFDTVWQWHMACLVTLLSGVCSPVQLRE